MILKVLSVDEMIRSWTLHDGVEEVTSCPATDKQLKGIDKKDLKKAMWMSVTFRVGNTWHNRIGISGRIYLLNNEGKTVERV